MLIYSEHNINPLSTRNTNICTNINLSIYHKKVSGLEHHGTDCLEGDGVHLKLGVSSNVEDAHTLGDGSSSKKEVPVGEPGWQMQKSLLEASGMILQSCSTNWFHQLLWRTDLAKTKFGWLNFLKINLEYGKNTLALVSYACIHHWYWFFFSLNSFCYFSDIYLW